MDKKYLNEERYKKGKGFLVLVAILILVIGVFIGGFLIYKGISKVKSNNATYSEENKQAKIDKLNEELNAEKLVLETRRDELRKKGIESSSDYESGEKYELYLIVKVLDPSFDNCAFDEYKNSNITSKYCSLKNDLEDARDEDVSFDKSWNSFGAIPFFMIGGFLIFVTLMISGNVFVFAKRREIVAFTTQQVMPIAKEGAEELAPVAGNAVKEIAKGIKEGINEADSK